MVKRDPSGNREAVGRRSGIHDGKVGREDSGLGLYLVGGGRGRSEEVPDFGHPHGGMGVYQAVTEVLAVVQAATVPVRGAIPSPCALFKAARSSGKAAGGLGRIGKDVLHIPPAKPGIRIQHQGGKTCRQGCCGRGATEGIGVIPAVQTVISRASRPVGGHGSGRGRDEDVGAIGGIRGDQAGTAHGGNGDRRARGVEGFADSADLVITCGFDVDRAKPPPSRQQRRLELGGVAVKPEVGRGAIAVVGDVEFGQAVERGKIAGPVGVDVIRTAKDADRGDRSAKGDADATAVVVRTRDKPRHRRTVPCRPDRQAIVSGNLKAAVIIGGKIPMGLFDTVIPDADRNVGARVIRPDPLQPHGTRGTARVVESQPSDQRQMPLGRKQGVVGVVGEDHSFVRSASGMACPRNPDIF